MLQQETKWFTEKFKLSYEFFKTVGAFSISIIAFFGGFAKFASPNGEFSITFIYGMYILGITVIVCFFAMMLHVLNIGSEDSRLIFIGYCWFFVMGSFTGGLALLLSDFSKNIDLITLIIVLSGIIVIVFILIYSLDHLGKKMSKNLKKSN